MIKKQILKYVTNSLKIIKKYMRKKQILKYVSKDIKGIEIAPWHQPIAPKKDGFNILTLDIFSTLELREKAAVDPNIPTESLENIEEVDFVISALDIDLAVERVDQLGKFDYIISSHNFEHLPNPIKFLQACGRVLKNGGHLSMAIPNKQYTFDLFRPLSTTTDLLRSFYDNQSKPSPYQIFNFSSNFINNAPNAKGQGIGDIEFSQDLKNCFDGLKSQLGQETGEYIDVHVSVFTPDSFNLIMAELISLELIPFKIKNIIPTYGSEFYAHLEKIDAKDFHKYKLSNQQRIDLYKKLYV